MKRDTYLNCATCPQHKLRLKELLTIVHKKVNYQEWAKQSETRQK